MAELSYEYAPLLTSFFTKEKTVIIPTDLFNTAVFSIVGHEGKSILEIKTEKNCVTLDVPNTPPSVIKEIINNFYHDLHAW